MNINFLKYGFNSSKLTTTVYLIQLVLAVTIGLQVYQVIDASIGHSVSLEGLKSGNAHMVVNDLLNVHGASLSPLIGQVRWLILVYLIMAAFIHAGIWTAIIYRDQPYSFWTGGARYFLKCFSMGLLYMLLLLVISIVIWLPFLARFGYWMEHLASEAPLLWGIIGLGVLWSICCIFLFTGSAYGRILIIRDHFPVFKAFKKGLMISLKKTFSLLPALFVVFILLAILYLMHGFVDDAPILSTTLGIFLLFGVQQAIVWVKIALRISTYRYLLDKAPEI